ncbi:MAG: hypothetical protein LQ351_001622 [Letrouitia transgressa]|nr:MAG: hypothetical protein LQ351_001622 [Letrouitia transgressa]
MSSKSGANPAEPTYVGSARELEDTFNEMRPIFEGKESEQNWGPRDKSILKLRKITKGNAPEELTPTYLSGIKSLLDGILKVVNSLRTTPSTNACSLIQEIAQAAGSGIDNMVEILLQSLIKLCASTKTINTVNGNATVTALFANVSYNPRLMQHIWAACQDKNVQPRKFAASWLMTLISKHRRNRHVFEHGGGLELVEKCLKNGLTDANPSVREGMRPTYWAFARVWPEKSEAIMLSLDSKAQQLLIDNAGNPNRQKLDTSNPPVAVAATKSTSKAVPTPSIKDTIAAKRREAEKAKSAAPSSAPRLQAAPPMTRGLSSAPMRPSRMTRKPTETSKPVQPFKETRWLETWVGRVITYALTSRVFVQDFSCIKKFISRNIAYGVFVEDPSYVKDLTSGAIAYGVFVKDSNSIKELISCIITYGIRIEDPIPDKTNFSPASKTSSRDISPSATTSNVSARTNISPREISPEEAKASPPAPVYELSAQPHTPNPVLRDAAAIPLRPRAQTPTQRLSPSPQPLASRKEGKAARKALEELPVNEPVRGRSEISQAVALPLLDEDYYSGDYHKVWKDVESRVRQQSPPLIVDDAGRASQLLASAIRKIGNGTLDVHGFRRLQGVLKGAITLLQNDVVFQDLLFPLLDQFEKPSESDDIKRCCESCKSHDVKTQILCTLRLMLELEPDCFKAYFPRTLCALINARMNHRFTSHMVMGIEETTNDIIKLCSPGELEDSIDAILDLVESDLSSGSEPAYTSLYSLTGLLHHSAPDRACRPFEQEERLGKLAAKYLQSEDGDVRRAVTEYTLAYHDFLDNPPRFWDLVAPRDQDHVALITYYLARREQIRLQQIMDHCATRL